MTQCTDRNPHGHDAARSYSQYPRDLVFHHGRAMPHFGGYAEEQPNMFQRSMLFVEEHAVSQTLQTIVNETPNKIGLCIATCCTRTSCLTPEYEIHESESVDRMKTCMETDLGYPFLEVSTNTSSFEMKTLLNVINDTQFPSSYRWLFFYYFGHGNEEHIFLSDCRFRRSLIIDELTKKHKNLSIIIWFECCRKYASGVPSCQSERTENTLIINATGAFDAAFYIPHDPSTNQKSCGIMTHFFTENVTKLNKSIDGVMAEVRNGINRAYGSEYEVRVPETKNRLINDINLLAGSTGLCRVCPYDVSAQYMAASSQAIVKWHFDENVLRRISEFRVLLASSGAHDGIDGKLPIAGRDVEAGHCFQLIITTPPNKIYTPSVTAIYDDQEESKTEGKSFETNDTPSVVKAIQRFFGSRICRYASIIISLLLIACSLPLIFSTIIAYTKLPKAADCLAYNIYSSEYIECGTTSSLYRSTELTQCPKERDDKDFGTLNTWRIRKNDLKLTWMQKVPELDCLSTSIPIKHLLNGYDIYEWKGSIIEGYCCITNFAHMEQTASLFLYLNESYAYDFQDGKEAHNELWSETIRLPSNSTSCFQRWGNSSPYVTKYNSYHIFGVDLPSSVELKSNVTVLQRTVNMSDYRSFEPRWFTSDNSTTIPIHGSISLVFSLERYIFICGPPFSQHTSHQKEKRDTNAISTHVCKCNNPKNSAIQAFLSLFTVSLFVFVVAIVIVVAVVIGLVCSYTKKLRERLRNGYAPIQVNS